MLYIASYHSLPQKMASLTINDRIYQDARTEARKQHRSTASLIESLIIKEGISTGDQKEEGISA